MITYFVNVIVASTALALVMESGLHQSLRIDRICRKSVAYYYLAANMSMNLLFAPVGGFALAIVPFRGCSALELHGWPSSREAMKLTKTSERGA